MAAPVLAPPIQLDQGLLGLWTFLLLKAFWTHSGPVSSPRPSPSRCLPRCLPRWGSDLTQNREAAARRDHLLLHPATPTPETSLSQRAPP